jgi:hypothetical protein
VASDDLRGYCLRCLGDTHARVVRQLRADHYGGIALGFVREVDADAAMPAVGRGVNVSARQAHQGPAFAQLWQRPEGKSVRANFREA